MLHFESFLTSKHIISSERKRIRNRPNRDNNLEPLSPRREYLHFSISICVSFDSQFLLSPDFFPPSRTFSKRIKVPGHRHSGGLAQSFRPGTETTPPDKRNRRGQREEQGRPGSEITGITEGVFTPLYQVLGDRHCEKLTPPDYNRASSCPPSPSHALSVPLPLTPSPFLSLSRPLRSSPSHALSFSLSALSVLSLSRPPPFLSSHPSSSLTPSPFLPLTPSHVPLSRPLRSLPLTPSPFLSLSRPLRSPSHALSVPLPLTPSPFFSLSRPLRSSPSHALSVPLPLTPLPFLSLSLLSSPLPSSLPSSTALSLPLPLPFLPLPLSGPHPSSPLFSPTLPLLPFSLPLPHPTLPLPPSPLPMTLALIPDSPQHRPRELSYLLVHLKAFAPASALRR
ncbi:hypothetical protein C7M84_003592 [Penaeus vannamei]|uniref:Uncharacterized protein n=1 Tax=Penaeus vannamei TaxID=6689 RepID=A0A3R7SVU4_PENVA|nr:hypothetical protein C7M84_003592 [Penaeus vannamei]